MMQSLFDSLPISPRPAIPDGRPAPMALPPLLIVIPGDPVAKGRPRVRIGKIGGRSVPMLYAPKETQDYEDKIRQHARRALNALNDNLSKFYPIDERPIGLLVRAYLEIPKSWPKKDVLAALRGEIYPLSKPDHDNFMKMASDALNGLVYRDDSLVTDSHQIKRYSENPRMEIEVYV